MNNQCKHQKCLHCKGNLPCRINTTICRNCRFKGHKEFERCSLCGKEQLLKDNPINVQFEIVSNVVEMSS